MKVFLNANEGSACDYHRIILPFKYLKEIDIVKDYKTCDVYIFNRFPHLYDEFFFEEREKYGFKYIIDLDDYWLLNNTHYLYNSFIKNKVFERTIEFIKNADYVTVTNKILYFLCKKYNPKVEIIKNALPFGYDQFVYQPKEITNTKFGYCGGFSHVEDLKIINKKYIAETNIDFNFLGLKSNNLESIEMFNQIPFQNKKHFDFKPLENYMDLYNEIDVSLVPLKDNFFNNCKSNLKILEAGCKGIPVIASNVFPYNNKLDKRKILLADNHHDWVRLILKLKNDKLFLIDKGLELKEHVEENYCLFKQNEIRKQIINSI